MATLTRDDILNLAKLAKLELSEEEIETFKREITAILGYVEQLQSADVAGFEPTYQVTGLKSVTRPDEIQDYGAAPKGLLKNVPAIANDGHIKVRRVL